MQYRNNVNLSLVIQLAKVNNNKMNEKRRQEYQTMDPEYVTGQIKSRSLIMCFPSKHKRYSSHLQVWIIHRVAPLKVFLL